MIAKYCLTLKSEVASLQTIIHTNDTVDDTFDIDININTKTLM